MRWRITSEDFVPAQPLTACNGMVGCRGSGLLFGFLPTHGAPAGFPEGVPMLISFHGQLKAPRVKQVECGPAVADRAGPYHRNSRLTSPQVAGATDTEAQPTGAAPMSSYASHPLG